MKKLALVLFIVLAAAGLWWWESPRLATENLLDAAHDGDVAERETLIDVEKFQASLRALPEWPDASIIFCVTESYLSVPATDLPVAVC